MEGVEMFSWDENGKKAGKRLDLGGPPPGRGEGGSCCFLSAKGWAGHSGGLISIHRGRHGLCFLSCRGGHHPLIRGIQAL